MGNEGMSAGQLLKQANRLKREGRLDEAIALYHQAIEINPNFAWAYNNLGDAFVKQGKLDSAITQYYQAIDISPNSAWFFYCLGEALARQGSLEVAAQYLQKAIDLRPGLGEFYNRLDRVLTRLGNFHEAKVVKSCLLKTQFPKEHIAVSQPLAESTAEEEVNLSSYNYKSFDRIIFFNPFHNGDIHLSREFVKDICACFSSIPCFYEHGNSSKLLYDIDNLGHLPLTFFTKDQPYDKPLFINDRKLYINTWIGQERGKYLEDNDRGGGGCTLGAHYKMYKNQYVRLGITDRLKPKKSYVPSINFEKFSNLDRVNSWAYKTLLTRKKSIFISNQKVMSKQIKNFSFDNIIASLALDNLDKTFFATQKTEFLENKSIPNLFFTGDITKEPENDLNENAYISTKCSLIVGRSSGPYEFTKIKDNLFDEKKTFVCFDENLANGHWVSNEDDFIKAKVFYYNNINEAEVLDILRFHVKNF